jgi:N-methylhydantoinase A
MVAAMAREGEAQLRQEGAGETAHEVSLDLRYLKQYHEVTVPMGRDALENGDIPAIEAAFHLLHNQLYGYDLQAEGTGLELINVRVRSLGRTAKPPLPRPGAGDADPSHALKQQRRAYLPETGSFADMPVYDGHRLLSGNRIPGPALVERTDTTVFLSSTYTATVDECGSILIERQEGDES